jgi:sodium-dependent dicarboxylate transporter 2/3/5
LITLWTNEGLHLGFVSLLPLVLFPTFGVIEFDQVTPNYSKTIIFLFMGGFLLAIGMQKTGLHEKIAHSVLGLFPNSLLGILYALAITSGLMSGILSNTTVTLLLIPIAMFLSDNRNLQFRMILAVAYGATIGGILTPIGTPPNMIFLGFAESHGIETPAFFEWILKLLPLVIPMMMIVPFVLSLGAKEKKINPKSDPNFDSKLNSEQKKMLYILLGLIIILFANSPIKPFYDGLGLNEKIILLGAGLSLFLPKIDILTWEDFQKFPFAIIFLFGASFSIASAFTETGLAKTLAEQIAIFEALPFILILILLVTIVCFTTEITSNTALISVTLPVLYQFFENSNIEHGAILMFAVTIVSSYAFMLPIATAPNAIAISTGFVKIKTMAKIGFMLNIIGIILLVFVAYFIWI